MGTTVRRSAPRAMIGETTTRRRPVRASACRARISRCGTPTRAKGQRGPHASARKAEPSRPFSNPDLDPDVPARASIGGPSAAESEPCCMATCLSGCLACQLIARVFSCHDFAGFWRHDGLDGLECFQCPDGAKCEVRQTIGVDLFSPCCGARASGAAMPAMSPVTVERRISNIHPKIRG